MADEPAKPRPQVRARTIHELRSEVKARDKFLCAGKPEAEGIALLVENYRTDEDSARAFVGWLKKGGGDVPAGKGTTAPGGVAESWHRRGDIERGTEALISDDESARARAPKKGKKK